MDAKIEVKDVKINKYTAKEAMFLVMEFMKRDSLQVVERIMPENLKQLQAFPEYREGMESFEIIYAGSRSVLESAGVKDERLLEEADTQLFVKMFVRFLHKNHARVFLLAENEALLNEMQEFLMRKFSKIKLVGSAILDGSVSEDHILNRINGHEVDCIVSAISSPHQEAFVLRNRMLLNAKVWLGLGGRLGEKGKGQPLKKMKEFIVRQFLKKEL